MFYTSLQSGFIGDFHFNWHFANYADAIKLHGDIYVRSLVYAGIVTALALVLAYPVAYWIAFYGGRRKSVFLFLLLLPFFVSFIIVKPTARVRHGVVLGACTALDACPVLLDDLR